MILLYEIYIKCINTYTVLAILQDFARRVPHIHERGVKIAVDRSNAIEWHQRRALRSGLLHQLAHAAGSSERDHNHLL